KLPVSLSQLRQRLGQKAKQEPRFTQHVNRRSQRRFRKPQDVSYYAYLNAWACNIPESRATA
ncbi:MAG TPA: hypothetical protein VF074_15970, partial [Pyrinomonadaceae bacterium]